MKKILIAVVLTAITFTYCGYLLGLSKAPKTCAVSHKPVLKDSTKHFNEPFTVEFADSVDGRPTYNITFSDSTGLDTMYPEEIAVSLITGQWQYSEDFAMDSNSLVRPNPKIH